jgi:hypothetical protein
MKKSDLLTERKPKKTVMIHMFTAGPQISSSGQKLEFSTNDLDQVVSTYDPKTHEAPLIIGHDQDDGTPSLGWVKNLWRKGKELWGKVELTPKAEQLIEDGVFKKVSSSFYLPDAETNPHPGKMSLRHLGLVTIPAVKGLAAFSENGDGTVTIEFEETKNNQLFKEALGIDSSSTMTKKKITTEDFGEGMTININIGGKPHLENEKGEPVQETGPAADVSDINLDEDELDEEGEADELDSDLDDESDSDDDSESDDDDDDFDLDDGDDEEDDDDFDMDDDESSDSDLEDIDSDSDSDDDFDSLDDDMDSEDDEMGDMDGEDDTEGEMDTEGEADEDKVADLAANYSIEELERALEMKKEEGKSNEGDYDYLESKQPGRVSSYAEKTITKSDETLKATKSTPVRKKEVVLSAEAKALQDKVAKLEEELSRQKRLAREKEIGSFAEGLYNSGKITEQVVSKTNLVKFMSSLNYKGAVNFSEGTRSTQLEFFKEMLESLPSMVSFEEVATPASAPKKRTGVNFSEPSAYGYAYDSKNLNLHQQAIEYSESKGVDYVSALKTILSNQ